MTRYMKNPVGAHYGLGDWLLQRLTAVVMLAYTVVFGACVLLCAPASYADWKALFAARKKKTSSQLLKCPSRMYWPASGVPNSIDSKRSTHGLIGLRYSCWANTSHSAAKLMLKLNWMYVTRAPNRRRAKPAPDWFILPPVTATMTS